MKLNMFIPKVAFRTIYCMNEDATMTSLAQQQGGYIENFIFWRIEMSLRERNFWVTEFEFVIWSACAALILFSPVCFKVLWLFVVASK